MDRVTAQKEANLDPRVRKGYDLMTDAQKQQFLQLDPTTQVMAAAMAEVRSGNPLDFSKGTMVAALDGEGATATVASVDSTATTDPSARTVELIEALRPGQKGDQVKELQKLLGLDQQGTYGPKTEQAVKEFVLKDTFAKVNADLGTNVNFGTLLEYEGFSLDGYVPDVPNGKSGVTVGVGFDLGQIDDKQLKALGLSSDLTDKLKPYVGLQLTDATAKLTELGGLKISVSDVRDITYALKKDYLGDVMTKYDGARAEGVNSFTQLTSEQQTVVFSRFFHQGINFADNYPKAKPFWTAVTTGNWANAQTELRNYPFATADWYKNRVNKEADLLGDLTKKGP